MGFIDLDAFDDGAHEAAAVVGAEGVPDSIELAQTARDPLGLDRAVVEHGEPAFDFAEACFEATELVACLLELVIHQAACDAIDATGGLDQPLALAGEGGDLRGEVLSLTEQR